MIMENVKYSWERKLRYSTKYTFDFISTGMMPFEDFLSSIDSKTLEKSFNAMAADPFAEEGEMITFPRFYLQWLSFEVSQIWFDQIRDTLTKKDILYIIYHYLFHTPLYTRIEIQFSDDKSTEGKFSIINQFSLNEEIQKINQCLVRKNPVYDIQKVNKKRCSKKSFDECIAIGKRWEWKTTDVYHIGEISTERKEIFITPIVFFEDGKCNFEKLQKLFKTHSSNHKYEPLDIENPTISLKSWEIFEYFVSTSLNPKKPVISKIRDLLRENNIDETSLTDQELEEQVDFINGFLSNILK